MDYLAGFLLDILIAMVSGWKAIPPRKEWQDATENWIIRIIIVVFILLGLTALLILAGFVFLRFYG